MNNSGAVGDWGAPLEPAWLGQRQTDEQQGEPKMSKQSQVFISRKGK